MSLRHWIFVYVSTGLPEEGDVRVVESPASTTVLAGYPSVAAARTALGSASGPLAAHLDRAQLVEMCGAFSHAEVAALRGRRPLIPVGLVGYAGEMTGQLHAVFGDD